MDVLLQLDYDLFEWINNGQHAPWLDELMSWWRTKLNWWPLYVVLLALAIYDYRRWAIVIVLGVLLAVGIGDTLSSKVIKPAIERPRPCRSGAVEAQVLVHCGGGYSFTSSHATNHFAIAVFLGMVMVRRRRWLLPTLLLWAGLVAVAQVYVGVHFPTDVIAGGILGSIVGWLVLQGYYWLSGRRVRSILA